VRIWALAACVAFSSVGASSANPLDSPGTVYIDGVPCNLACQSYMAWSHQMLNASQPAAKRKNASAGKAAGDVARKRLSKRVIPASADARSHKTAGLRSAPTATPESPPRQRTATAPVNVETRNPQATLATAPELPPSPKSTTETAPTKAETPEVPRERSLQEQVMAALAVAEQITNAEMPRTTDNHSAEETKSASVDDAKAAPPRDAGALVVLLISQPDVKAVSTLKGLNVAIDAAQSNVEQEIHFALVAAGATEAQLSISDTSPLDRLISKDVQAAVLKLVSPDAAEAFPDIKGFKVFRVPLTPR
jgi:hypothetical protein